jgi:hypothetical protein
MKRNNRIQLLLDEMKRDHWFIKLKRWYNLKLWTYKCMTRKYWDKEYENYIFKNKNEQHGK